MKNSNDTIGNQPATFRLVAQCLNRVSCLYHPYDYYVDQVIRQNYVYMAKIRNLAHLKEKIQEAGEMLRDMLQSAWLEVEYLLDICRDLSSAHADTCSLIS